MPLECAEINAAASASSTSSVSYMHSGNGHWYFGMFGGFLLPFCVVCWRYLNDLSWYGDVSRVAKIQNGGLSVNSVSFERRVSAVFSLLSRGNSPKCCLGLFTSYGSLIINRNESISDVFD